MRRRDFIAAALAAPRLLASPPEVRFGVDLFSIRSQNWTPFQYLDYCAKWGAKVVHFSEIRFIGNLEDDHLRRVREHAERLGIEIELGMRSICPTSKAFDPSPGTAEQQITRMLRAAKLVGSPIVRCFQGTFADRSTPGGIDARIEDTIRVLRAVRPRVIDSGLRIAIENHAGDMQARELKRLIEAAGPDFVGACLDSGNPLWALEDPHLTLETLAPYVLTSHIRDSAVWRVPEGAAVAWVRMGEGNVGIDEYVRKYRRLCPGRALSLEIIVTGPRIYPYLSDPKFWDAYRTTPAWEFSRFLALVEKGKPVPAPPPVSKERAVEREREDLEASIQYTRRLLTA
ncbi:MAG TPA: sugar phosphate isomerase/epimerase [Bryobacteraceae bacterium]|jgi:sugar phosphate isomerase/epimerase|nr:sugar phosphate isomerase/epimerase [Bryobacteraceae bacterium]